MDVVVCSGRLLKLMLWHRLQISLLFFMVDGMKPGAVCWADWSLMPQPEQFTSRNAVVEKRLKRGIIIACSFWMFSEKGKSNENTRYCK